MPWQRDGRPSRSATNGEAPTSTAPSLEPTPIFRTGPPRRIYPFGLSKQKLEQAINELSAPAATADSWTKQTL